MWNVYKKLFGILRKIQQKYKNNVDSDLVSHFTI